MRRSEVTDPGNNKADIRSHNIRLDHSHILIVCWCGKNNEFRLLFTLMINPIHTMLQSKALSSSATVVVVVSVVVGETMS